MFLQIGNESMKKTRIITIPAKLDETSTVVAQVYKVTDRYVRMIVNGHQPKGIKAQQKAAKIKELYDAYKKGKQNLIRSIESLVKVA